MPEPDLHQLTKRTFHLIDSTYEFGLCEVCNTTVAMLVVSVRVRVRVRVMVRGRLKG